MIDNRMKSLFILVFIYAFSCNYITAQNQLQVIKAFQKNNLEYVNKHSTFPFTIENFGLDTTINHDTNLRLKIIKECVKIISISELKKGVIIKTSNNKFQIIIKTFSKDGELESESTVVFYFKKVNKLYKLHKILLTG
jgi:hypothetical protein